MPTSDDWTRSTPMPSNDLVPDDAHQPKQACLTRQQALEMILRTTRELVGEANTLERAQAAEKIVSAIMKL